MECESFECLRDLSGLSIRIHIPTCVLYYKQLFGLLFVFKIFFEKKKELKRDFFLKNIYISFEKTQLIESVGNPWRSNTPPAIVRLEMQAAE